MLNFFAALPSAWPRHGAASFLELEADGAVAGAALQPIDHAGSAELRRWVSAIKGEGPGMREDIKQYVAAIMHGCASTGTRFRFIQPYTGKLSRPA